MNVPKIALKIILTKIILLLLVTSSLSQNVKMDSLLHELETAGNDTNKVNLLYNIAKGYLYNEPDKAMEYNAKALELANNLDFYKGEAAAAPSVTAISPGELEFKITIQIVYTID